MKTWPYLFCKMEAGAKWHSRVARGALALVIDLHRSKKEFTMQGRPAVLKKSLTYIAEVQTLKWLLGKNSKIFYKLVLVFVGWAVSMFVSLSLSFFAIRIGHARFALRLMTTFLRLRHIQSWSFHANRDWSRLKEAAAEKLDKLPKKRVVGN